MDPTALAALIQEAVPSARIELAPSLDQQTTLYSHRDDVVAVAEALKDHPQLRFALLIDLTAVDFWPREPRFEVLYLLVSIEHRLRLRWKVRLSGDDARLSTVSGVWPAANWLEREVWDLFGIEFDRHPDPRRLLMPEDWEGYPLRKDYPVQINLTPRATEALQVTEEEFRANLEKDRLARR
jgi:NADH-quinone oxidoreductase subunit C